jgi:hypothetical protein
MPYYGDIIAQEFILRIRYMLLSFLGVLRMCFCLMCGELRSHQRSNCSFGSYLIVNWQL